MIKSSIFIDKKHVASMDVDENEKEIAVRAGNIVKILTTPAFVKLALSLKAKTGNSFKLRLDTTIIKSVFGK